MDNNNFIKSLENITVNGYFPDNRGFIVIENIKDELFIHGGSNKSKEYTQIDLLDTKSMQWNKINDISNANPFFIFDKALSGHTSTLVDNHIFIYGGFDGNSYTNSIYMIDTYDYSFQQIDVRECGEYPMARNYHTANLCLVDNVIYIFGGWNGNIHQSSLNNFSSLWKFDIKGKVNL